MIVKNISNIINNKINSSLLTKHTYISTENMLPDFGGISVSSSLPQGKCTMFYEGDILLSNIRPYFKKLWFAKFDGGCSNDVIVIRANKEQCLPRFLYYALSNNNFFDMYVANCKGTKMPRGSKESLLDYKIPDCSLSMQQHIVNIRRKLAC